VNRIGKSEIEKNFFWRGCPARRRNFREVKKATPFSTGESLLKQAEA
jgi:hypothetical protein